ncbi:MAG: ECF-type sigma factor [Clostridia bacterium]|nr:ECF-type sigma factor [Clostridia bacterium]
MEKIWGKTMLTIQRYLERVTKAIDSLIYKKALASGYVSSKRLTERSAFTVTNDIINLSQRKVNLINLNIICLNALKGIEENSAKLLILKFIDGLQSAEIASILGFSNRTYFRKLEKAYDDLGKWLKKNNFINCYFERLCKNEGWIMDVFYKNLEENKEKDIGEYINNVVKKLKKSTSKNLELSL